MGRKARSRDLSLASLEYLQLARVEGVALADIACLVTFTKPAHSLFRSAVRKRIGHSITARSALQSVVANRSCRAHCFLDVARFDDLLGAIGIARPYPGQKISL